MSGLNLPVLWSEQRRVPLAGLHGHPVGRDGRLLRTATALIEMLRDTKKGSRSSRAKIRS
jgi:hypothetical protein